MLRRWISMAKLIYSAIARSTATSRTSDGNFDWAAPGRGGPRLRERPRAAGRHVPLRAADVRGDALWETMPTDGRAGRHPRLRRDLAGGRQGRLLARRSSRSPARERGSNATSTRRPSAQMKGRRTRTSAWAVRGSPPTRSRAGLVDEYHLFLTPIVVGRRHRRRCPTACAWSSNCSTSAGSPAAWFTPLPP